MTVTLCSSNITPEVRLRQKAQGSPPIKKHTNTNMHTQECSPQAAETCCHSKQTARECSKQHERMGRQERSSSDYSHEHWGLTTTAFYTELSLNMPLTPTGVKHYRSDQGDIHCRYSWFTADELVASPTKNTQHTPINSAPVMFSICPSGSWECLMRKETFNFKQPLQRRS